MAPGKEFPDETRTTYDPHPPALIDPCGNNSTGGIIALSLFEKNDPVEECIQNFKRLCQIAFTPREFHRIAFLQKLATAFHGSIYKAKPFESILREFFGSEDLLYGGKKTRNWNRTKVAITATALGKLESVLMTNYNRHEGPPIEGSVYSATGRQVLARGWSHDLPAPYSFLREHEPRKGIKMWEA